jgi:spore germination cell wall hydrolase CwlJ-like protein
MERVTPTLLDVEVLARTLYGEARGEGRIGMEAVATTIQNRLLDKRWPGTWAKVCQQRWQFSCWNENDPNLPKLRAVDLGDPAFRLAYAVAAEAVAGEVKDLTNGANHYLTKALFESDRRPSWAVPEAVTCRMGRHVFLKL